MELSFSQRHGFKPIRTIFQIDNMDTDLRNALWNYCIQNIFEYYNSGSRSADFDILSLIWTDYLKKKYFEIKYDNVQSVLDEYYLYFLENKWYEIFDLLEFIVKNQNDQIFPFEEFTEQKEHINNLNKILEREMSGYRFIGIKLSPITSEEEIECINNAQMNSPASTHIQAAIGFLSDRTSPNYRNSIKESISAVEAICRELTNESSLGNALKAIEKKNMFEFNNQLRKGLEMIYAYTNDKDTGIRHALLDSSTEIKFEDAKFMIIICSAFVNYITDKSNK